MLILLTGLIPSAGVGVVERVLALFRDLLLQLQHAVSRHSNRNRLGPIVVDLVGMVAAVYILLALVATPVSVTSFRRHQVS